MTNRIHSYLDGDLSREALTPGERAAADRLRATLDAAAGHLRATPAPDLTARVMASIPAAPERLAVPRRSPVRAALAWLWSPRPVRVALRPAYGVAFAALAAVLLTQLPGGRPAPLGPVRGPAAVARAPEQAPPVFVQFRLAYPGARSVRVAGTFTGWEPTVELRETAPGEWSALVPLEPGVHDYAFVVDGERWVADPHAPQVDDDFGGTNSRISLPPLGTT